MIVVKGGDNVQALPSQLTLRQKLEAFIKYKSTQVIALFSGIAGLWLVVPDDLKADIFSEFPLLAKWKTLIYFAAFAYAFYQKRMDTQVVSVAPVATSNTVDLPPPLVLAPSQDAPLVPTVVTPNA